MRIIALCGSLRRKSYNLALLRAAVEFAPPGMEIVIHPLNGLPMFDEDETDANGVPAAVESLTAAIAAADGVLIANPEYSHAYSGALKNALDWISVPDSLAGKPVTAISAAPNQGGGVRGQQALRHVLFSLGARVMVHYELLVRTVKDKFDQDGRLTHDDTRIALEKFLADFAAFVRETAAARV